MIIKARHHWFYHPFFKYYSRWMPKKDFSRVELHHNLEDRGLPVLMIGNHISWWDGFFGQYINLKLFDRKIHIMMLEEQLKQRMFLNKTGAYSIKKGERSAIESIHYTTEILSDPGNLVLLYPQGKIHSLYDYPLIFEDGWYRILRKLEKPIQLVFYVALFDFYSNRKPEVHIYLQDYNYPGKSHGDTESAFNQFLEKSISSQKSRA